jgi:transposase InsO family protein
LSIDAIRCRRNGTWSFRLTRRVRVLFHRASRPQWNLGSPSAVLMLTDNAFIESFNGKLRSEYLNAHWFMSLDDARRKASLAE